MKCEGWTRRQPVFNDDHRYPPNTDAIHCGVAQARVGKRITIRLFFCSSVRQENHHPRDEVHHVVGAHGVLVAASGESRGHGQTVH